MLSLVEYKFKGSTFWRSTSVSCHRIMPHVFLYGFSIYYKSKCPTRIYWKLVAKDQNSRRFFRTNPLQILRIQHCPLKFKHQFLLHSCSRWYLKVCHSRLFSFEKSFKHQIWLWFVQKDHFTVSVISCWMEKIFQKSMDAVKVYVSTHHDELPLWVDLQSTIGWVSFNLICWLYNCFRLFSSLQR